ncbi:16 kDa beta-galactoside-binding lectin-like [Hemicordylus capensis]|uniref:16 kDa beta-galactoside-binding lectin-like n=1 Tax=Hemicordylus capensis TaxID=884348 RepID=UPI0023034E31|nr:16 kDa beta-galactoside-binding lectin-like [Hemicordylus capensis]
MERGVIADGLNIRPGEGIQVRGRVLADAKEFCIDLGKDCDNLLIRFNPRFAGHKDTLNTVICNSKQNGVWGDEEEKLHFPFLRGELTKVSFTFATAAKVKVNMAEGQIFYLDRVGQQFSFPNRLGLEAIQYVSVGGDFRVKGLNFF